jgi:hypothetical protein
MDIVILSEGFEEKEIRLGELNEIDVKRIMLKKQLNELDKQAGKIINMDVDYKRYLERYNKCEGYFGNLDYEKYCSLLKLFMKSSPDSELYIKLAELLKIHCPIESTTDNDSIESTFNKELWQQVLEVLSKKLSEIEFRTWIKSLRIISNDKNSIKIAVNNEFSECIVKERYESILLNTLKEITENNYFIEYTIAE